MEAQEFKTLLPERIVWFSASASNSNNQWCAICPQGLPTSTTQNFICNLVTPTIFPPIFWGLSYTPTWPQRYNLDKINTIDKMWPNLTPKQRYFLIHHKNQCSNHISEPQLQGPCITGLNLWKNMKHKREIIISSISFNHSFPSKTFRLVTKH